MRIEAPGRYKKPNNIFLEKLIPGDRTCGVLGSW